MVPYIENASHAGARLPGTHHVGRRTGTEEQAQGVHHDGLAAAGLAGEQVEATMEVDAEAIHHGVVLHYQLLQHACDYNVS